MSTPHLSTWTLRRHHAEEDVGEEARTHLAACAECRATLEGLTVAQRDFEREHPLPAFTQGVMRARTRVHTREKGVAWLGRIGGGWIAAAAAVILVIQVQSMWPRSSGNRLKGSASVELRVAGRLGGPQRIAAAAVPEPLGPGERVRIGYQAAGHRYVAAISVDQTGTVTPLYPERGMSLPAERADGGNGAAYLPGSLEFTGRGTETVVVVLSESPLEMEALSQAARDAYRRSGGRLESMPPLNVPGEEFRRQVLKP